MSYDQAATEAALRDMGAQFNPDIMMKTRELFRAPVDAAAWAGQRPIADIAYGPHARHRLDIYPTATPDAPILLFIHGGGFVAGDKASDPLFYGNVPRYFARHGYLAAAMNYRLAPEVQWPAGAEDVAAALRWLVDNARDHGGDPSRIVLLGQSAGASHSASVLFDRRFDLPEGVRAAALLSGFYQAQQSMLGGPALYFGDDENRWSDMSPATHVMAGHVPLLLGIAELDPAVIAEQTLLLAQALTRVDGSVPRLHWFEKQNHVSTVHGLGLGDDSAGRVLRAFFDKAVA